MVHRQRSKSGFIVVMRHGLNRVLYIGKLYELPVTLIWSHFQAICYVQWQNAERARIQVGSKCKVFRHFSKSTKYSIDTMPYGAPGNLSDENLRCRSTHPSTRLFMVSQ